MRGWGGGLLSRAFFFSLKFILSLPSYFPPARDLSASQPAQPLVGKRGCSPRGFLGEPPPAALHPSPRSSGARLCFPAALTRAPWWPGSPRMMRKRLRGRSNERTRSAEPLQRHPSLPLPAAPRSAARHADLAAHRGC